jgi:hypothetical protein
VRVRPGTYRGEYMTDEEDDGTLERLPIILNVDNLHIIGSMKFQKDHDGWPTDPVPGTEATLVKETPFEPTSEEGDQVFFLVTGDGTSITGLVLDMGDNGLGGGIELKQVDGYLLHRILTKGGFLGAEGVASSGKVLGSLFADTSACGWCAFGPGRHYVFGNRSVRNNVGMNFTAEFLSFPIDLGGQDDLGVEDPFVPGPDDALEIDLIHNDLSENGFKDPFSPDFSPGLMLRSYDRGDTVAPRGTGHLRLSASLYGNRLRDNDAFGVLIDTRGIRLDEDGSPERTFSATVDVNFDGRNDIGGNCRAPLLLSVHTAVFPDFVFFSLENRRFLENSEYTLTFKENALEALSLIHPQFRPIVDPMTGEITDGVSLDNVVTINGEVADFTTYNKKGVSSGLTYNPFELCP